MTLDTQDFRALAVSIRALKQSASFTSPILNSRHAQIMNSLDQLAAFFERTADLIENNEASLYDRRVVYVANTPGWNTSFVTHGTGAGLLRGRTVNAVMGANYAYQAGGWTWSQDHLYAYANYDWLSIGISGNVGFRLMKNNQINPRLSLQTQGQAHLFGAETAAGVDLGLFDASVRAAGEVGSVRGEAKCIFSVDEQVISAQAGAALARGECEMAFDLAGLTITMGLSGSVGSVEAGFEYANTPGVWGVSVNGALLAGAGLSVRVEYN